MFQILSILGMALVIVTYTGIALAEMQSQPIHAKTSHFSHQNYYGLKRGSSSSQTFQKPAASTKQNLSLLNK